MSALLAIVGAFAIVGAWFALLAALDRRAERQRQDRARQRCGFDHWHNKRRN